MSFGSILQLFRVVGKKIRPRLDTFTSRRARDNQAGAVGAKSRPEKGEDNVIYDKESEMILIRATKEGIYLVSFWQTVSRLDKGAEEGRARRHQTSALEYTGSHEYTEDYRKFRTSRSA